jgi:hypothetical protein
LREVQFVQISQMMPFPSFRRDNSDLRIVQIQDDMIGVEPFDPPNLRLIAFRPGSDDGPIQIERDRLAHLARKQK